MRTRQIIELDSTRKDSLILEVLLDIRGLLEKPPKEKAVKKRGRPPKV